MSHILLINNKVVFRYAVIDCQSKRGVVIAGSQNPSKVKNNQKIIKIYSVGVAIGCVVSQ